MNPLFTKFDRDESFLANDGCAKIDFCEKTANVTLAFLRISFGKTYTISDKYSFTPKQTSSTARIAAIVASILLFPIAVIATTIGMIALYLSKSYWKVEGQFVDHSSNVGDYFTKVTQPNDISQHYNYSERKKVLAEVLQEIDKDENIRPLLNQYFSIKREKKEIPAKMEESVYWKQYMKMGTCYGQAMAIFQNIKNDESDDFDERLIFDLNPKQFYKFQILHSIHVKLEGVDKQKVKNLLPVFAQDSDEERFFQPEPKLELNLKTYVEKGCSDEEGIKDVQQKLSRLSTSEEEECPTSSYCFLIALRGESENHITTAYYSESQNKYFWHDPYSEKKGLFSSKDKDSFFNGLAVHLFQYRKEFSTITITPYSF